MKTIQEAAKQHADACKFKSDFPHHERSEYNGFLAGVEYAQMWISVEEEMPNEFPILTKDLFGTIDVFRSLTERMASAFDIVSWRPINIE